MPLPDIAVLGVDVVVVEVVVVVGSALDMGVEVRTALVVVLFLLDTVVDEPMVGVKKGSFSPGTWKHLVTATN